MRRQLNELPMHERCLYRHLGFARSDARKSCHPVTGGREDALIMTRPL